MPSYFFLVEIQRVVTLHSMLGVGCSMFGVYLSNRGFLDRAPLGCDRFLLCLSLTFCAIVDLAWQMRNLRPLPTYFPLVRLGVRVHDSEYSIRRACLSTLKAFARRMSGFMR